MRRSKAGSPLTVQVMSPISRSITTGAKACWLGWSTIFCVVFNSSSLFLNLPLTDPNWSVMSGNLTMLLARSIVYSIFFEERHSYEDLPHSREDHECLLEVFSADKESYEYLFSNRYDVTIGDLYLELRGGEFFKEGCWVSGEDPAEFSF